MDVLDGVLSAALDALRDAASSCALAVRKQAEAEGGLDAAQQAAAQLALVALDDIAATADRIVGSFELDVVEREEVVWIERSEDSAPGGVAGTSALRVAPLEVAEELAQHLFGVHDVFV